MENTTNISNKGLVEMTTSLLKSFGAYKWLIGQSYFDVSDLYYHDKDYVGCIKRIGEHFNFKNKLIIDIFQESHLENNFNRLWADSFNYVMIQKTVASVKIPTNMPLYGTSDFSKFPIEMRLNKEFTNSMFPSFVYIISHEFSHIVLHSTGNKFKDSEIATDILAAIIVGPGLISAGRKSYFSSLGYIRDDHFEIARKIIYSKSKEFSMEKMKCKAWLLSNKNKLSE